MILKRDIVAPLTNVPPELVIPLLAESHNATNLNALPIYHFRTCTKYTDAP